MPVYVYRCAKGHEYELWRSIKTANLRDHICECGVDSVQVYTPPAIAADALPNKRHGVRAANAREKRWDVDLPAYARLRKDGLHPKSVDGAHLCESEAKDPLEVSMGRPLGDALNETKELHAQLLQNKPAVKGPEIGQALREGREVPV